MSDILSEFIDNNLMQNNVEIICNQQIEFKKLNAIYSSLFKNNYKDFLNSNILENERKIIKLTDTIRKKWINKCSRKALQGQYRSNFHDNRELYTLINNVSVVYDYERILDSMFLKNNEKSNLNLLTSSCMGAINILLNSFQNLFYKKEVFCFVGYYETKKSLSKINPNTLDITYSNGDIKDLTTEDYDIFIIEPVSASYVLNEFPLGIFVEKLKKEKEKKLRIIIFDNSFFGGNRILNQYIEELLQMENILIFTVRSLIKLDQQGLDLCFSGLISIYYSPELYKIAYKIYEFLKEQIDIFGIGLKYLDYCLLENNVLFNDENYGQLICTNTRTMYENLKNKIKNKNVSIYYPNNIDIPVIYIEFIGEEEQFYIDLCDQILYEAKVRDLTINCRTSFGFRNISFEYFKLLEEQKNIFKIAPGALIGVNHQILVSVLENFI